MSNAIVSNKVTNLENGIHWVSTPHAHRYVTVNTDDAETMTVAFRNIRVDINKNTREVIKADTVNDEHDEKSVDSFVRHLTEVVSVN